MGAYRRRRATINVVSTGSAEPTPGSVPGDATLGASRPIGPPSRQALGATVLAIIALVVANNIGNAVAPALLPVPDDPTKSSNPLLLIALSPAIRNQVAVVNYIEPWWFLAVAGLRLLVADPLFFLLGRWYGDAGIKWMERRSAMAGEVGREVEKWFAKVGPLAVFVAANNIVCLLSGASNMRRSVFWAANIAGTLTRLLLIMWFADLLNNEIDTALNWVGDYRPFLLALSVAVVAVVVVRQLRSGGGQLGQLRRLGGSLQSSAPDGSATPEGVTHRGGDIVADNAPAGDDSDVSPAPDPGGGDNTGNSRGPAGDTP